MPEYDTIITRGHVYAPQDKGVCDVGIRGEKITVVGDLAGATCVRRVDAAGMVVMPGVVETHAHMLLPFGGTQTTNDFYTGTVAGAYGGVTTLIDFADQRRGGLPLEALAARHRQSEGECAADYSFHCTLTDITDEALEQIPCVIETGVTSFKFYTAYREGGLYVPPQDMERAFAAVRRHGGKVTVHAEDEDVIHTATQGLVAQGKTGVPFFPASKPVENEIAATKQVIELARRTGAEVLIRHVSSGECLALIAQAQKEGLSVTAETCPHYLALTQEVYARPDGALYTVNPILRTGADRDALWAGLRDGAVSIIGTDDCGFYRSQKTVSDKFYEIPGGMPGLEARLPLLVQLGVREGRLTMEQLVRALSTNPAQWYGLYPQKGAIRPGSDADLAIFSETERTKLTCESLHEMSDYCPYEGMAAAQFPRYTLCRGSFLVDGFQFTGRRGGGKFFKRAPARLP